MKKILPQKLQALVSWSVGMLGECIKEEFGEELFREVEKTRKEMKAVRQISTAKTFAALKKAQLRHQQKKTQELYRIAHSFALMLELINSCEIAYRTYRVEALEDAELKKKPMGITYVLTAHPTEARSTEILQIFSMIQTHLFRALKENEKEVAELLRHLLKLCLHIPMARDSRPTVADEAQNIYSIVLRPVILDQLVDFNRRGIPVYFRAWVGGDKDGHPGVDEKTMLQSLQLSRQYLLDYVSNKLENVRATLALVQSRQSVHRRLYLETQSLLKLLQPLKKIGRGDGLKVKKIHQYIQRLHTSYLKHLGVAHPELEQLNELVWIFPALVLPLELREDSGEVKLALNDKNMAINRMLETLKIISHGYEARWYVRGFVLSMVESASDLLNGLELTKKRLGTLSIPVVPLFENETALVNSVKILTETFKRSPKLITHHQKRYQGRFEVMLGYSDSSKENGVFYSRYLISKALFDIDRLFQQLNLTPIFFHGSGGSVERGGGSVREQTYWWPKSAVSYFKATVQGEMVARTFANEELLRRQVDIISSQLMEPRAKQIPRRVDKIIYDFALKTKAAYAQKISDEDFLAVIELATPYSFLNHLKMGSRPTKRTGPMKPTTLRAIPWILCWTQTRTLFPTWWGVGSSFKSMSDEQKWQLKSAYKESALLRSYIKALGFTLAKVELPVWRLYLESSNVDAKMVYLEFEKEYRLALEFVRALSDEKSLLWFRPWLEQSIHFRSSMIHPLNIIQIEALRRKELALLRETVTGISCGMLTTG